MTDTNDLTANALEGQEPVEPTDGGNQGDGEEVAAELTVDQKLAAEMDARFEKFQGQMQSWLGRRDVTLKNDLKNEIIGTMKEELAPLSQRTEEKPVFDFDDPEGFVGNVVEKKLTARETMMKNYNNAVVNGVSSELGKDPLFMGSDGQINDLGKSVVNSIVDTVQKGGLDPGVAPNLQASLLIGNAMRVLSRKKKGAFDGRTPTNTPLGASSAATPSKPKSKIPTDLSPETQKLVNKMRKGGYDDKTITNILNGQ